VVGPAPAPAGPVRILQGQDGVGRRRGHHTGAFTFWVGASWQFRYALLAALATSLVLTQFLAHGMTSPLRMALAQTERLGELVANLLDLSRLEGGAIPLQLSLFRVDEFLHEAVGLVAPSPHGVDVVVRVSPPDLVAVADPIAALQKVNQTLRDQRDRYRLASETFARALNVLTIENDNFRRELAKPTTPEIKPLPPPRTGPLLGI
jgi:hypothetical protein